MFAVPICCVATNLVPYGPDFEFAAQGSDILRQGPYINVDAASVSSPPSIGSTSSLRLHRPNGKKCAVGHS